MKSSGRLEAFVFIVTYGRSGSTVVQRLLNELDGYHVAGENFNALHGLFKSFSRALRAKSEFGNARTDERDPWYCAHLIGPERYGRRLVDVFIEEIIVPPKSARVVGFKEIRFFEYRDDFERLLDFMKHFLQPARFIFNLRSHDDVEKSGWWPETDTQGLRQNLEAYEERMRAFHDANQDASIMLKYEDYCDNPEGLRPLFDFLGEPFDRELVAKVLTEKLIH